MSKTASLIKESFLLMDRDFDGHISHDELIFALRFIGIPCDYSMLDEKSHNKYSLSEYTKLAKSHLGSHTPEEHFANIVRGLDKNKTGSLAIETTVHLVMTMSDMLSDEDLVNFKNFINPNNEKTLSIEEFTSRVFA